MPQPMTAEDRQATAARSPCGRCPDCRSRSCATGPAACRVLLVVDEVQEPVVDVVHAHDDRRSAHPPSARFVQLTGGPALDAALVNRSFRAEIAASERDRPQSARVGSPARPAVVQHGAEVQARCRARSRAALRAVRRAFMSLPPVCWRPSSGRLQRVFALLPVARAQLVRLQCVQHAQYLLRAAADRQVGHVDEAARCPADRR